MGSFILFKFDHFYNAAFIIMSFGLLVFFLSLMGILGATRESSKMSKSVSNKYTQETTTLTIFYYSQLFVFTVCHNFGHLADSPNCHCGLFLDIPTIVINKRGQNV